MLRNFNFTRLQCTDCGKMFELLPGEELLKVSIVCKCKIENKEAIKKRGRKKAEDATETV